MKNQSFARRLGFASSGIVTVWRRERSFRTQSWCALATIVGLIVLRPGFLWTALAVLAIAAILALELINAALEYLIDHLHPALADEIGAAKDAAAGAVLMASIAAAAIGTAMLLSWSIG